MKKLWKVKRESGYSRRSREEVLEVGGLDCRDRDFVGVGLEYNF